MLSGRIHPPGRLPLRLLGALAALVPLLACRPARAADATSLVPANVAFHSSMLHNKEQFDAVVNSKAFKRLQGLPLVQMAHKKIFDDINKEGGPGPAIKAFLADPENKELVEVLKGAVADEVFVYGGKGFADLFGLYTRAMATSRVETVGALISGGDSSKAQFRSILRTLTRERALLKVPDLVIGFKVKDTKKVENQIARLEKLAKMAEKDAPPPLQGRLKRQKAGGSSFLTIELDGGMVPWDDAAPLLKGFEEKAGEFDPLVDHLKKQKLTFSLGTRAGYLLFAITPTAADLSRFGRIKAPRLSGRPELKPLTKHADRKITSISYVSKAMNRALADAGLTAFSPSTADVRGLNEAAKVLLDKTRLPEAKKKEIEKDVADFVSDFNKYVPERGAVLSFEFLTDDGYEGYIHDYGDHKGFKGAHFNLLGHFGGHPILAAGFGTRCDGEAYATSVKWMKKVYGHVEPILLDKLGPDEREKYDKFTKGAFPLLKRLDKTTGELLLPALKDASFGFVVDAKWKSTKWFKDMPPAGKAMPMAEVGLVISLADSEKFLKALKNYRTTLNELFEVVGGVVEKDNVRSFRIPPPENEKGVNGDLYYYKIPEEAGLDRQFRPTLGVSKTVAALTLSKGHTERLLKKTPLKLSGPIAKNRKRLVGAAYFDGHAFLDAVGPWIEFAVVANMGGKEEGETAAIVKQVRTVLDVLKAFHRYSAASYLEGGVLVTHTETIIKDR
jgi:hypothetical protein